jgi:hypothetical protein
MKAMRTSVPTLAGGSRQALPCDARGASNARGVAAAAAPAQAQTAPLRLAHWVTYSGSEEPLRLQPVSKRVPEAKGEVVIRHLTEYALAWGAWRRNELPPPDYLEAQHLLARGSQKHLLPEHRRLKRGLLGFTLLPAARRHRGQPGADVRQRLGVRAPRGDLIQLRLAEVQLSEERVRDGQVQAVTVFVGNAPTSSWNSETACGAHPDVTRARAR